MDNDGRKAAGSLLIVPLHGLVLILPSLFVGAPLQALGSLACSLFLFLATVFCITEIVTPSSRCDEAWPPMPDQGPGHRFAYLGGATLLVVFWVSLGTHLQSFAVAEAQNGLPVCAGSLVMTVGIGLRSAAMRVLGAYFVSEPRVRREQSLIRCGLYRYLRHPSETGLLCVAVGGALLLQSLTGLCVVVGFLLPVTLLRIREEERVLLCGFGEAYRNYSAEVRRLVPYVL